MKPTIETPKYTLWLGDCLDVMREMEAGSVDAILTDLPYGTTQCAWDEIIPFAPMWAGVKHVLKKRGVFVTTASQPFTSKLVMSNLEWFRYEWVWNKTIAANYNNVKFQPRKLHENVLIFSANSHTYNPQKELGTPYTDKSRNRTSEILHQTNSVLTKLAIDNNGDRYPSSVQVFSNPNNDTDHPTQKPVALYKYLVATYTNPGDTVLDICAGSGTTGVAALALGRRFVGVELRQDYFDIAAKRIAQAALQEPLFTV